MANFSEELERWAKIPVLTDVVGEPPLDLPVLTEEVKIGTVPLASVPDVGAASATNGIREQTRSNDEAEDTPLDRHSGAGRNPVIENTLHSSQNPDVVPLAREISNHLDSGLRRNDVLTTDETAPVIPASSLPAPPRLPSPPHRANALPTTLLRASKRGCSAIPNSRRTSTGRSSSARCRN